MKDYYAKFKDQDLWCIKENGFDPDLQSVRESQFTIGNGLTGIRGALEEIPKGAHPGTYIAGVYDRLTSQVDEIVNFPNPFFFKFTLKGEKFGALAMDVLKHHRVLNMRDGVLTRRTIYSDSKKRRYDYQSIRFMSMDEKNIGVMQIVLTPLDADAEIELQTSIDTSVYNLGMATEGRKKHFYIKELAYEDHSDFRRVETLGKHQQVIYRSGFYYKIGKKKVYSSSEPTLTLKLRKKQTAVFTKIFYIGNQDHEDAQIRKGERHSRAVFNKAYKGKFETLLKKHTDAWHKLWDVADVQIEGTSDIQRNLRFNIFHMLICAQEDDGFSSIGAKTLSGEGYRGHIFWDAEIFNLPFFIYVLPDVAKNMLMYRYKRLEPARAIAKKQGYKGIMFPWESAATGEEETPTWAKDLDGKIIRIKTNELEHHITADVAFAVCQYVDITDDQDFMNKYGCEIVLESARFWASRVKKNLKGQYEIKDVIGPDEFHEHVNNNAYTNYLARWNLFTGYQIYHQLKKNQNKLYKSFRSKLGLTDKEVKAWKSIAHRIKFHIGKDHIIEEFDGYFKKRYIELKDFDENNIPKLPEGVAVQEYGKTQLVKQADVLMFLHLFGDEFSQKVKEANFHYYYKRTLHKSSLSAAMHALVALDVEEINHAYQFFNVALRADISNLHGNTADGIHAASLGGVWQSVVNGFAGVYARENLLTIRPEMPHTWKKIKCSIFWKQNLFRIETKNSEVRIRFDSKLKKKRRVCIFGKTHLLSPNKDYTFHRRKIKESENYY